MEKPLQSDDTGSRPLSCSIVGAGLVGSVAACFLGRRGLKIDVFEYRPDPRIPGEHQSGRSINLALSTRGRSALRDLGLEESFLKEHGVPMRGRMIHRLNGTTYSIPYHPTGEQCIYSVSRKLLNEVVLSESSDRYENVRFHFNHKVMDADFNSGELMVQSPNGEVKSHQADIIIGADGAHSAIRRCMMRKPRFNFSQTYIEHGYLELTIPSDMGNWLVSEHLHIWPRGTFMMIALPNRDKTWTVTVFMPYEQFSKLRSPKEILEFFDMQFPDAVPLIGSKTLVKDFMTTPPSPLVSIKCNPYHLSGKVLIIGDAAHAMVPFYGQGMNAGFEDCLILDELWSSQDVRTLSDVQELFSKFNEVRNEDAQAICDLAMYNYVEMRDLVNQRWFLIRKSIDDIIFRYAPKGIWVPLYVAVTFSRLGYRECLRKRKMQDKIVNVVVGILFLLILFFISIWVSKFFM